MQSPNLGHEIVESAAVDTASKIQNNALFIQNCVISLFSACKNVSWLSNFSTEFRPNFKASVKPILIGYLIFLKTNLFLKKSESLSRENASNQIFVYIKRWRKQLSRCKVDSLNVVSLFLPLRLKRRVFLWKPFKIV